MSAPRILVTGSRKWEDRAVIRDALLYHWTDLGSRRDTILIQGECPAGGADKIAKEFWETGGMPVIGFYAGRSKDGKFLGPERNQRMVDFGADVCIAFPLGDSVGTWDCIERAKKAGIPVTIAGRE